MLSLKGSRTLEYRYYDLNNLLKWVIIDKSITECCF